MLFSLFIFAPLTHAQLNFLSHFSWCNCAFSPWASVSLFFCSTINNELGVLEVDPEFMEESTNKLGVSGVATRLCRKYKNPLFGFRGSPNNTASADGCVGVFAVAPYVDCWEKSWWATKYRPMCGQIDPERSFPREPRWDPRTAAKNLTIRWT